MYVCVLVASAWMCTPDVQVCDTSASVSPAAVHVQGLHRVARSGGKIDLRKAKSGIEKLLQGWSQQDSMLAEQSTCSIEKTKCLQTKQLSTIDERSFTI